MIEAVAGRVQRLQEDVRAKERSLASLTAEKTELQRQMDAVPKKYVRDFIEKVLVGDFAELTPRQQLDELARHGNNHSYHLTEGLAQGKESLWLEVIDIVGGEQIARSKFGDGGIKPDVVELFSSIVFDGIVQAYSDGMSGGPGMISERFGRMLQGKGIV